MALHGCDLCGDLRPLSKCSECGRHACRDHYGKREAMCSDCLGKRGEKNHPRSILHPIFH